MAGVGLFCFEGKGVGIFGFRGIGTLATRRLGCSSPGISV